MSKTPDARDVRPFVVRWRERVAAARSLVATDKHVALTLSLYVRPDGHPDPYEAPTLGDLAAATSRKDDTVAAALSRLGAAGWLTADRPSRRRPQEYTLRLPASPPQAGGTESPPNRGHSNMSHPPTGETESPPFGARVTPDGGPSHPPSGVTFQDQSKEPTKEAGGQTPTGPPLRAVDGPSRDVTPVVDEALTAMAQRALQGEPDGRVHSPERWVAAKVDRLRGEHGPRLTQIAAEHRPATGADLLALDQRVTAHNSRVAGAAAHGRNRIGQDPDVIHSEADSLYRDDPDAHAAYLYAALKEAAG